MKYKIAYGNHETSIKEMSEYDRIEAEEALSILESNPYAFCTSINGDIHVSIYKNIYLKYRIDESRKVIYILSLHTYGLYNKYEKIEFTQQGIENIINEIKLMPEFFSVTFDLDRYLEIQNDDYAIKVKHIKRIMSAILKEIRKGELYSYYDIWINFEIFFNILGIRDHFIHNFNTFILGCYFISKINIKIVPSYEHNSYDYMFSWILASTFHDIGYPIEHFPDLNNKISELYRQLSFTTISNQLDKLKIGEDILEDFYILHIDNGGNYGEEKRINLRRILIQELMDEFNIDDNYAQKIIRSLEIKQQHGLVSACILMKNILNNKGADYFESRSYKLLLKSAVAVFMHHFSSIQEQDGLDINLYRVPMTVMLIICDELQEWDRPTNDLGLDEYKERLIYKFDSIESEEKDEELLFIITLDVEEAANYSKDDVLGIIKNTLKDKKEKFDLIKNYNKNAILCDIKIKLIIKYMGEPVGNSIEKYLAKKNA